MVKLFLHPVESCFDSPKRVVSGQLAEEKAHELGPAGKSSYFLVPLMLLDTFFELVARNPLQKLREYRTGVHKPGFPFWFAFAWRTCLARVLRRPGFFY